MRAHARGQIVDLALVAPATPLAGAQSAVLTLRAPGQQFARRGDFAAAQAFFGGLADQHGPLVAPRALILQARAALADADTDTAEAVLQELLNDYPSTDQLASAYFTLEQVRRAAGDCSGAMRALAAYESVAGRTAIGPY